MSTLTTLESMIEPHFEGAVTETLAATGEIDNFTDVVARVIAARVLEIPDSIACKAAAIADMESRHQQPLIGLLFRHLLKKSQEPLRYVPVAAIAPAVAEALEDYSRSLIELPEWAEEPVEYCEW